MMSRGECARERQWCNYHIFISSDGIFLFLEDGVSRNVQPGPRSQACNVPGRGRTAGTRRRRTRRARRDTRRGASASRDRLGRVRHTPAGRQRMYVAHTPHTTDRRYTRQRLPQSRASRKWRPPSSSSRAISIGAPSAVVTPRENGPHIPSPNVAGIRMYGAPLGSGSR